MKVRYRYRIYPTHQQRRELEKVFGCCRVVWNDALALVKAIPRGQKWPSSYDLLKICITEAKKREDRKWLSEVSNIPLQQTLRDLGVAFKNYFDSKLGKRKGDPVGFPHFKKKLHRQSVRFTKNGFKIQGNKVYISKIGKIKIVWSRPLPSEPSSVTVIKERSGHYFLSFVVEVKPVNIPPKNYSVGVDLGLKTLATLSTGEKIKGPDLDLIERKIRRGMRKLSRTMPGSKRRERIRLAIARMEARLANIRRDFNQKLATRLVRENSIVVLEDLQVSKMVKTRTLARAISKVGWRQIREMCEAKAAMITNREVRIIPRYKPTSQICSYCGYKWGKLKLWVRTVVCPKCGTEHDRDVNAALNILAAGLADLNGQPRSGVRPRLGATARLPTRQEAAKRSQTGNSRRCRTRKKPTLPERRKSDL